MPFSNGISYHNITTDPALIVKFEEQWRQNLEKRLALNPDDSLALQQIEFLNGPKDKYRWTNNSNCVALVPGDSSWNEEQLLDDVNELTQTEFKGTIPFSRHVLTAVSAHESPLPDDEDDLLVQYRLGYALMQDESPPVIVAMNRDARNVLDPDT